MEVVLGSNEDLFTTTVRANRLNFMAVEDIPEEIEALGKIRYNHRGDTCKVKRIGEDLLECHFDTPVRAVTPGQALVLYQGRTCVRRRNHRMIRETEAGPYAGRITADCHIHTEFRRTVRQRSPIR